MDLSFQQQQQQQKTYMKQGRSTHNKSFFHVHILNGSGF